MSKPKFEFLANSALPGDESGVAIWRYIEERGTDDVEIVGVGSDVTSGDVAAAEGLDEFCVGAEQFVGLGRCGVADDDSLAAAEVDDQVPRRQRRSARGRHSRRQSVRHRDRCGGSHPAAVMRSMGALR